MRWIALTRTPGNSYVKAISSTSAQIDPDEARRQHDGYCRALRNIGLEVITLPPDERFPDGCFVEDAVVVRNGRALLTRSGAPSRQGEGETLRPTLEAHRLHIVQVEPPGTLDGGDVLWVENVAYVGLGDRTNREGIAQLAAKLGVEAHPVPLPPGMLHLKSGAAYLGNGRLYAVAAFAPLAAQVGLDWVPVPAGEEPTADALVFGAKAIIPAGYPRAATLLKELGLQVQPVNLSEFAKADGGPTCLSVIWPE
ncbi:MAG: dimethylarginine dimethylaminohydrolase family protein [Anaerolineae bacterium]